jgi:hypothetical protein
MACIKNLEKIIVDDELFKKLKTKLVDKIQDLFKQMLNKTELVIATILNPNFKIKFFKQHIIDVDGTLESLKNEICTSVRSHNLEKQKEGNQESFVNRKKFKRNSLDEMIDSMIDEEEPNSKDDLLKDFTEYLTEGVIKCNAYEYWRSKSSNPLFTISRKYFSIVASSIFDERLYSRMKRIVTDERSNISDERVSDITFVKMNLPLIEKIYDPTLEIEETK